MNETDPFSCYAQVVKSPNDHQGAGIRCKSKSFYYQGRAGAPTVTHAAAKERSPSSGLHCLYRVFSREKFEQREFPGWETSNWLPSVEGLGVGF